jgi:hypothetical protein
MVELTLDVGDSTGPYEVQKTPYLGLAYYICVITVFIFSILGS